MRILVESTVLVAFGTGLLFVIGFSYYRGYFGYFGNTLVFPSLATTDYLTKAFDLMTSQLVLILAFIWASIFGVTWEVREKVEEISEIEKGIVDQNREIGRRSWEILGYKRTIRKLRREAISSGREDLLDDPAFSDDFRLVDSWRDIRTLSYRFFPFEFSLKSIFSGLFLNLYIILSYATIFISASSIEMNVTAIIIYSIPIFSFVLWSILKGQSAYNEFRRHIEKTSYQKINYVLFATVGIGYLAITFAGSAGKHDARQFAANDQAGSVVAMVDVGQDASWLQLGTFRVLLIRDGLYYAIPLNIPLSGVPNLYVFPASSVISVTSSPQNVTDSESDGDRP